MTSRSLSSDNRRHRAGAILAVVLFAAFHLFLLFLEIERMTHDEYSDPEMNYRLFLSQIRPNYVVSIAIIILAILMAFSAFGYLHNKQMVDFYHALPVSKGKMYRTITFNSILLFTIGLVVDILGQAVIAAVAGFFCREVILSLLTAFLFYLMVFLLNYSFAVLAVLLTGNALTGLLGISFFGFYAPVFLMYVFPLYAETFFKTYAEMGTLEGSIGFYCFSPLYLVALCLRKSGSIFGFEASANNFFTPYMAVLLIIFLLWIIGLSLINSLLYKKRPSEAAGQAMAFKLTKPLIKLLGIVPAALYTGFFVYDTVNGINTGWLIGGIIIGTLFFHAIIEIIFEKDIKGLYHKPISCLILCAIAIGISQIFVKDIFHYDHYLPKTEEVETVKVDADISPIYKFWGTNDGLTKEHSDQMVTFLTDVLREGLIDPASEEYDRTIRVTYQLTGKRKITRQYPLSKEQFELFMDQFYVYEDFKDDVYSIYTVDINKLQSIRLESLGDNKTLDFTEAEIKEFIKAYISDLNALTYDDIKEVPVINGFSLYHFYAEENDVMAYDDGETYSIYATFTNTIAYLESKGFEVNKPLCEAEISQMDIEVKEPDGDETEIRTITDPEIIGSIKNKLIYPAYYDQASIHYQKLNVIREVWVTTNGRELMAAVIDLDPEELVSAK